MLQTTIGSSISCMGTGLHSGKRVQLLLHPAPENTGIVFHVHAPSGTQKIIPSPYKVVATGLATTLGSNGASVATVEHLMAALYGLGIDNIIIEVKGGELPIMDGSAASFVLLLKDSGLKKQKAVRSAAKIIGNVKLESEGKWIKASPYNGFRVNYTIDFAHPSIGVQKLDIEITPETFAKDLAKARTFGFLKEVEYLNSKGLALGGSLDNAVVLDEYTVMNKEGLRYADEFVRHKILDFVGDMAMFGMPLLGYFEVYCSGHGLNNAFLCHLDENKESYLSISRSTNTLSRAASFMEKAEEEESAGLLGAAC